MMGVLLILILIGTNVAASDDSETATKPPINLVSIETTEQSNLTISENSIEGNVSTTEVNLSSTNTTTPQSRRRLNIPEEESNLNAYASVQTRYAERDCTDTNILLRILSIMTNIQPQNGDMNTELSKLKDVLELLNIYIESSQSAGRNLDIYKICTNVERLVNEIFEPYRRLFTHFNSKPHINAKNIIQFKLPISTNCQNAYENIFKYTVQFPQKNYSNFHNLSDNFEKLGNDNSLPINLEINNVNSITDYIKNRSSSTLGILQNYRLPNDDNINYEVVNLSGQPNIYVNDPQLHKSIEDNTILNTKWLEQSHNMKIHESQIENNIQAEKSSSYDDVPNFQEYHPYTNIYQQNNTDKIKDLPKHLWNPNFNPQDKSAIENVYNYDKGEMKQDNNQLPQTHGYPINSDRVLLPSVLEPTHDLLPHNTHSNFKDQIMNLDKTVEMDSSNNLYSGNKYIYKGPNFKGGNINDPHFTANDRPNFPQYNNKLNPIEMVNFYNPGQNVYTNSQNERLVTNQNGQQKKIISSNTIPINNFPKRNPYQESSILNDKNKQHHNVHNLLDSQRLQGVSNYLNVISTPDNNQVVEITYVLQRPKNIQYEPLYLVKYRLPYQVFQHNINNLLLQKPYLKYDTNLLYHELLSSINFTGPLINKLALKNEEPFNLKDTKVPFVRVNNLMATPDNIAENTQTRHINHLQSSMYRVQRNVGKDSNNLNRLPVAHFEPFPYVFHPSLSHKSFRSLIRK